MVPTALWNGQQSTRNQTLHPGENTGTTEVQHLTFDCPLLGLINGGGGRGYDRNFKVFPL